LPYYCDAIKTKSTTSFATCLCR